MNVISIAELEKVLVELKKPVNLIKILSGLGASYVLYKTLRIYLKRRKYRHIPGPPTNGILGFYLGNALDIKAYVKNVDIFPNLLIEWHRKYGEVFKYQIAGQIFIFTSEKNLIKETLIVKDYPKNDLTMEVASFPLGERFLGVGLVTDNDYERWKARRAIFNHGFHRNVLMSFVDHFNTIMNNLTDKLRIYADGKQMISLYNEISRAALDAIALIAFGMHSDSINDENTVINSYLAAIFKVMTNMFTDPLYKLNPYKFKEMRNVKDMIKHIRKIGREKIIDRINAIKNNEHLPNDILTAILSNFKDESFDLESMVDDFVTFFVAGQETTANTLAFCFLEMGKNAQIVEKAREEVDRVLGARSQLTYADVTELKYCLAIFKEALRLYPPAAFLQRKSTEAVEVNGFVLPKNTFITLSTYVNGRYEKYFKNALEFKPERFLKTANSEPIENYVYHPFSLGPRNCIGQNFAQIEGVMAIAKIIQKFDIKLDMNQSFAIEHNGTLKPKDGTRCYLTVRS